MTTLARRCGNDGAATQRDWTTSAPARPTMHLGIRGGTGRTRLFAAANRDPRKI